MNKDKQIEKHEKTNDEIDHKNKNQLRNHSNYSILNLRKP